MIVASSAVLESAIQAAAARLNNEPSVWAQVDSVVDKMTADSNALNTRVQGGDKQTNILELGCHIQPNHDCII